MFDKGAKFADKETKSGYVQKGETFLLMEGYTDKKTRLKFTSKELVNPSLAKLLKNEFPGHIIESVKLEQGGVTYVIEYGMISLRLRGQKISDRGTIEINAKEIFDLIKNVNVSRMMRERAEKLAKLVGKDGGTGGGGGGGGGADLAMANTGGRE